MSQDSKYAFEPPDDERPASASRPPAETPPPSPPFPRHDPYAAFRFRNYRYYASGNILTLIGAQMMSITIGWELYSVTNSATVLGLVGLVQVLPVLAFALISGQILDRFDRKKVMILDQLAITVVSTLLAIVSLMQTAVPGLGFLVGINKGIEGLAHFLGEKDGIFTYPHIPIILILLFFRGVVRSFNQPAKQSMLPQLVPMDVFRNAVTWNSSMFETCAIIGPTLAGLSLWLLEKAHFAHSSYAVIYFFNSACQLAMVFLLIPLKLRPIELSKEKVSLKSVFAGFRFVWNTRTVLGAMSLDMFAVMLGGATALLPMFAKDILHVGSLGLGLLRAAPSIGACSMAFITAHLPPRKRAGMTMLLATIGFGAGIIIFGSSHYFWLSFAALIMCGMCDNTSVVIRQTLIQTITPDHLRGRVSAVNSMFISSSNELGEFESGMVAAIFGPVFAAIFGGVGTIAVVGVIALVFPELRRYSILPAKKHGEQKAVRQAQAETAGVTGK